MSVCSKNSINHHKPNFSQLILIIGWPIGMKVMQEGRWIYWNFEKWLFWVVILTSISAKLYWAPGSSLCNTLRTKFHVWTKSSVIVEFMVKFIWQHNLPVGSYSTFKMSPGRLDFWCSMGKKLDPPVTLKLKVREVSQSGFWNISSHPTCVPSFRQIGWPQLLAPGALSQALTLKFRLIFQGGIPFLCFEFIQIQNVISQLIFEIMEKLFQLSTSLEY